MLRKLLLMNVFMGISASLLSAQKVSTNAFCLERNSARIAQSLITMYGDSCVERMLDNNVQFVAEWSLDTLNHVVELKFCNIRRGDSLRVRNMVEELTGFLKERQVFLEMCYAQENSVIKDYIEQEMREGKTKMHTFVLFPGGQLIYYDFIQERDRRQGIYMTQLDYVKQHIKKYLPDGLQSDR